jgi:hypothetical protein
MERHSANGVGKWTPHMNCISGLECIFCDRLAPMRMGWFTTDPTSWLAGCNPAMETSASKTQFRGFMVDSSRCVVYWINNPNTEVEKDRIARFWKRTEERGDRSASPLRCALWFVGSRWLLGSVRSPPCRLLEKPRAGFALGRAHERACLCRRQDSSGRRV